MPNALPYSARGASVVVCSVLTVVIAGFVVTMRFFTRSRLLKFVGAEDWCICFALLFSIGNTVGMVFQTKFALGQHISGLSEWQVMMFLKCCYFTMIAYNISLTLAKTSILLLYRRIFFTSKMKVACYIHMGFVAVFGLWLIAGTVFTCFPVASFWDRSVAGRCLPNVPIWFLNSGVNIATDISIFVFPIPVIRTLVLPKRQKVGLYCVFALGFFVCMISITRLYSLHVAAMSTDPTWDNIGIATWSCIELNVAIICPSLATLKPLITRLFPRLLSPGCTKRGQDSGENLTIITLSGTNSDVLEEPARKAYLPFKGENNVVDNLNAPDTFDIVHLEGGLVRLMPKAKAINKA